MGDRATCWSITINNPTPEERKPALPAGWKLLGQMETGKEGTEHIQAMLKTPQVRFNAVKKVFPRAHIEAARNPKALAKYVEKEETRTGDRIAIASSIPTLFDYQEIIASKWDEWEFSRRWQASVEAATVPNIDEVAMCYLDSLVESDIQSGRRGAEFIAINPMWRASWKKFWRSIIKRHAAQVQAEPSPPADEAPSSAPSDA